MIRAIVWGTKDLASRFVRLRVYHGGEYDVICFADNDCRRWGNQFFGKEIISPEEIDEYDYERIVICAQRVSTEKIRKQLMEQLGVEEYKIITFWDLEAKLTRKIIEKYKQTNDQEIRQIISYYEKIGFNIYGDYRLTVSEDYRVEYDEDGWPFVWFEHKKMFFPKNFNFWQDRNGKFIRSILREQGENSPHLYIKDNGEIPEGSVIVDAGVCEGNFALRYVERAKKVYLFEADKRWIEPLKKTFSEYGDKVVLIDKYLQGNDSSYSITLDSAIKEEKIDFLKMDIEGAEVEALLGGKNLLMRSKARCAICSYHRQNDEKYIKYLLSEYGYGTDVSKGYMFFIGDDKIADSLDFRRGIVYGWKID